MSNEVISASRFKAQYELERMSKNVGNNIYQWVRNKQYTVAGRAIRALLADAGRMLVVVNEMEIERRIEEGMKPNACLHDDWVEDNGSNDNANGEDKL